MMVTHKNDFKEWVRKENIKVFRKLSEATSIFNKELSAGQTCTFTNEYGVKFPGLTIIGFCKPTLGTRCVYLDKDSYWFPVQPDSITLDIETTPVTKDTAFGFYEECKKQH